ncbi:unnamed protein product [Owenia fusiformis]|uniref:tRNA (guanine(9)-N(1))-methyltransferase n=1 Tax=Owenia fusiformis TaxID=6347 RepID=A0A8J1UNQ0_OWEFU|nr:unnamed protein product [Owenia fusiformis]
MESQADPKFLYDDKDGRIDQKKVCSDNEVKQDETKDESKDAEYCGTEALENVNPKTNGATSGPNTQSQQKDTETIDNQQDNVGACQQEEIPKVDAPFGDTKNPMDKDEETKEDGDLEIDVSKEKSETSLSPKPMSKKQMKKMQKRLKWDSLKLEKRAKERENLKKRKAEAKERGEPWDKPSRKKLKHNNMATSACKQRICVDCSFSSYMSPKDLGKTVKQLGHSYAANRRMVNPVQFYVTGVRDDVKQRLLEYNKDYDKWDVNLLSENYIDVFDKEDIVYLTSDSENIVNTLDDSKVYIIGGLVDHNAHKGLCYKLAKEKGLQHAQLPIGEYLQMKSSRTLTINHVFEIMVNYTDSKDWKEAFLKVLPMRKGATAKVDETKDKDIDNIESTNYNDDTQDDKTNINLQSNIE